MFCKEVLVSFPSLKFLSLIFTKVYLPPLIQGIPTSFDTRKWGTPFLFLQKNSWTKENWTLFPKYDTKSLRFCLMPLWCLSHLFLTQTHHWKHHKVADILWKVYTYYIYTFSKSWFKRTIPRITLRVNTYPPYHFTVLVLKPWNPFTVIRIIAQSIFPYFYTC